MARQSAETMNADELKALILWYEGRLKYVRFLLAESGGK